jgi:hypothetical protein
MGWIMAGGIKNYNKARKIYDIKAVCPVGMSLPSEKQNNELIERHNIKEKLFYLQGGFDKTKLKGIYKFMMNSLEKIVKPKLESKTDKKAEDKEMLDMMINGKNCVAKENLDGIIKWLDESK